VITTIIALIVFTWPIWGCLGDSQACLAKGFLTPRGIANWMEVAAQVGILAAAGLVALDAGFEHLAEDHRRAKRLAEAFGVDPGTVETNIVIAAVGDAPAVQARLEETGVRAIAISPTEIRLVTHRDVGDEDVEQAVRAAAAIGSGGS